MLEVSFLIKQLKQLQTPDVQLTKVVGTEALLSAAGKQSAWFVQDGGDPCRLISNGDEEARVAIMMRRPTLLIIIIMKLLLLDIITALSCTIIIIHSLNVCGGLG